MASVVADPDFTKLVFRAEPFSSMDSALRYELLSLARSERLAEGKYFYKKGEPPREVIILLSGKMRTLGEMPGTEGPVLFGEHGPGDSVGWDSALAGSQSTQAFVDETVSGIAVSAQDFLRIARLDPALRKAVLAQPTTGEIWRAVVAELSRRKVRSELAEGIVKELTPLCIARDWPANRSEIEAKQSCTWVISGGDGMTAGALWEVNEDVNWARLIGIPTDSLDSAIQRSMGVKEPAKPAPAEIIPAAKKLPTGRMGLPIFRTAIVLLGVIAGAAIGVAGWASRQPIVEQIESGGRLVFAGDAHDLKASVAGKLSALQITPGQKVTEGTVLAVVVPPRDEAKTKLTTETLAQTKSAILFCERLLEGSPLKLTDAPAAIAQSAGRIAALKSELRVKRAISTGAKDDPSLSATEKAVVDAHFAAQNANFSARLDAAQNDSSVRREDLAEAEQALRDAQDELRLQISAASSPQSERGDDAKIAAAAAARATASYRRIVAQRQDAVNRIRKEIAAIRTAPVTSLTPTAGVDQTSKLEAAIRDAEKEVKSYSASMRVLALETELALEQVNADAAPRQILAARAGIVQSVAALPKGAVVTETTVIARFITRQAWEVELPDSLLHALNSGRQFTLLRISPDGTASRADAYFTGIAEGTEINRAKFITTAADDGWRHGDQARIKTDAVVCSLLDRWLVDPSLIFQ